mmetsp:Transcript_10999/g.21553  ORF Transcript_10999/g.21553 Transcript_10999/m.21553 type:complete len:97 (-) Transcript_10999:1107-1397(-)|eukprot:CAMPEP_0204909540 /NCGR_PEP_ID=MMETSP1397-20131031/8239_1 /ASSEMBLY_ACC=CAM_ASM_000891 /TAXON_ID=49980 /ORGANISM="Climacostomum Climacostomum virens, Strain Stock W-24" /LENGTH=96 /DNA_ID=CAMNT_0052079411 /DNA_START=150 /DNA_END=440 /DNA_ORIENTATION=-
MWRALRLIRAFSTGPARGIEETVLEVLGKIHNVKKDKLSVTASFNDLGVDSLDQVEAVVAMEWLLKTEIPDEEALKIESVKQAIEVFSKYTKATAS